MEAIKICLSLLLLALYSVPRSAALCTTCQTIKDALPGSPSGKYFTSSRMGIPVEIYCEMGLNGGGYTFLPPYSLTFLSNDEISSMFTNRTSFLLRAKLTDGTQPYAVLTQLSEYANIPLMLGLNNHTGYNPPVNKYTIGEPYLYFGFLPIDSANKTNLQGLTVNGKRITFTNCDGNANSEMSIFPNFREVQPNTSIASGAVCNQTIDNLTPNPSGRVMPADYFAFMEMHFGGCGCFVQTNQISGKPTFVIGFK